MEKFDIVIKTQFGLEPVLAQELKDLGATDIQELNRAVMCTADNELMYKCNLHLRTAIKVLKPIISFEARNENQLYRMMRRIHWEDYMRLDQTLAIDGTTSGDVFTHSKYVALKTKDAIVDQFRDKYDSRPFVDPKDPDLRINVQIAQTRVTVSLDSSGTTLAKRGYRLAQTAAPMSEVLAAGIIYMSGWDKESDLVDPMCGSGTFSIEAALMARQIPAGMLRSFAFEKWNDFDADLFADLKEKAKTQIKPYNGTITAHDISNRAISIAKENAERAGVIDNIDFSKKDFLDSKASGDKGVILINPPYGERLEDEEEMIEFYGEVGTRLKHFYNGYDAWIISSNLRALKFIGLRPSRKIKLYNGPLECKLQKYELYRGSKKASKNPDMIKKK